MKDYVVYVYWGKDGDAIYVGQTSKRRTRDLQHRNKSEWYSLVSSVEYFSCGSASEARTVESEKIFEFSPKYNIDRPDHEMMRERHKNGYISPSHKVKMAGINSLSEMSKICGKSVSTLRDWYKNNPKAFNTMLAGCVFVKYNLEVPRC